MNKTEAVKAAIALGLAVYRGDTTAKIEARIAAHMAAQAQLCSATARKARTLRILAAGRTYILRGARQLSLPMAMPHFLHVACGIVAEG